MKRNHLIFIAGYTFVIVIAVYSLYFFLFFRPLRSNKELFPVYAESREREQVHILPAGKIDIDSAVKEKYGITAQEVSVLKGKKRIYFIDGREPEEYESRHIENARHVRATDIVSAGQIRGLFGAGSSGQEDALFVIYCHDGTRSAGALASLGAEGFKFLVEGFNLRDGGRMNDTGLPVTSTGKEVFDKEIKDRDFTISAAEAMRFLKSGKAQFIDVRLYREYIFSFARDFRIGNLSSKEYREQLPAIIGLKGRDIIFIADLYPDLFYAKLLIQRLQKVYGFELDRFFVLFGETRRFYLRLKKEGLA